MLLVTRVCTFIYCLFLKDPVDRSIISDGQETAKKVRHTNLALQRLEVPLLGTSWRTIRADVAFRPGILTRGAARLIAITSKLAPATLLASKPLLGTNGRRGCHNHDC